ncbi:hypothetical protein NQ314_014958 [Rhamnusium bicolor]|uniref:Uncharacterized protein n=1 Tax=Rhamnusium bicolor TaxID=1586634 RepID=A0AAV8X2A8_9CUCU|nr:hypothetical protein NQ314_014958 [Rhamnusium bicolor]
MGTKKMEYKTRQWHEKNVSVAAYARFQLVPRVSFLVNKKSTVLSVMKKNSPPVASSVTR